VSEDEEEFGSEEAVVTLTQPPAYVLVKTGSDKIPSLAGVGEGVIPLCPLERTFTTIVDGKEKKQVTRKRFPLTAAYTDYQSQGQTINNAIVDIATPPSGTTGISPFNVYVALSRCRGRESVRLLREFEENLVASHPCEYLWLGDARLERLRNGNVKTTRKRGKTGKRGVHQDRSRLDKRHRHRQTL